MTPILILNLQVEHDNYDINASPDKREVYIKNEQEILPILRAHLSDFFENIQRVKAYECNDPSANTKFKMDLLDTFKKSESPQ